MDRIRVKNTGYNPNGLFPRTPLVIHVQELEEAVFQFDRSSFADVNRHTPFEKAHRDDNPQRATIQYIPTPQPHSHDRLPAEPPHIQLPQMWGQVRNFLVPSRRRWIKA